MTVNLCINIHLDHLKTEYRVSDSRTGLRLAFRSSVLVLILDGSSTEKTYLC